jgi:hypothetical protein
MNVARKFLVAELLWTVGIALLILPITILTSDSLSTLGYIRWFGRALSLAAFPAGIAIAGDVFCGPRPWRLMLAGLAAASIVGLLLFALLALVAPLLNGEARSLPQLVRDLSTPANSWETRNDAAWDFYQAFFAPAQAVLLAAIALQVGIWARYSMPSMLRRGLYWVVALGLIVSGYAVADSTYEGIVLHTAADVSFAAFYTLLLPAGLCAGLALPTLALLRGATISPPGGT